MSMFKGSTLTLGQMADACVYVGGGTEVDSKAKPLDSILQRQDRTAREGPKFESPLTSP